jgi:hypothetical protein
MQVSHKAVHTSLCSQSGEINAAMSFATIQGHCKCGLPKVVHFGPGTLRAIPAETRRWTLKDEDRQMVPTEGARCTLPCAFEGLAEQSHRWELLQGGRRVCLGKASHKQHYLFGRCGF